MFFEPTPEQFRRSTRLFRLLMEGTPTSPGVVATPGGASTSVPRPSNALARLRYAGVLLVLAVVYVAAARTGLMLDAIGGFATLVWAPTGIALAALLLFGYGLWP